MRISDATETTLITCKGVVQHTTCTSKGVATRLCESPVRIYTKLCNVKREHCVYVCERELSVRYEDFSTVKALPRL